MRCGNKRGNTETTSSNCVTTRTLLQFLSQWVSEALLAQLKRASTAPSMLTARWNMTTMAMFLSQ
jgi:hypothetical protein